MQDDNQELKSSTIITSLDKIKKIEVGSLPLDETNYNYSRYISPFLFGESFEQRENKNFLGQNIAVGGIANNEFFENGELKNNSQADVTSPINGTELSRHSLENLIKAETGSIDRTKVLLHSDLLSILLGLSQIFYEKGFNKQGFDTIRGLSFSSSDLVKNTLLKIGDAGLEKPSIDESKFYEDEVKELLSQLLEQVITAALEYEKSIIIKELDTNGFLSIGQLKEKLNEKISKLLFEKFKENNKETIETVKNSFDNNPSSKEEQNKKLQENLEKIEKFFVDLVKDNIDFYENLLTKSTLYNWKNLLIYSQKQGGLYNYIEEEQKEKKTTNKAINQTEEYFEFEEKTIEAALEKHSSKLIEAYLNSLSVAKKEEQQVIEAEKDDDVGGENTEPPSNKFELTQEQIIALIQKNLEENKTLYDIYNEVYFEFFKQAEEIARRQSVVFDINTFANLQLNNENIGTPALEKIEQEIASFLTSSIKQLLEKEETKQTLTQNNLINNEEKFVDNLQKTDWYSSFIKELPNQIKKTDDALFAKITNEQIVNTLKKLQEEADKIENVEKNSGEESTSEQTQEQQEDQRISTATVAPPTNATSTAQAQQQTTIDETTGYSGDRIDSATAKKIIAKETAYAQEIVLAQLFTLNGIDRDKIPDELLKKIREDIATQIAQGNFLDVARSALTTKRTREIYQNIIPKILTNYGEEIGDFYAGFESTSDFVNLSIEQKQAFTNFKQKISSGGKLPVFEQFLTTEEILNKTIEKNLGRNSDMALEKNIKYTAETFVIMFGEDTTFVENINQDLLKLYLGLPTGVDFSSVEIEKYRKTIIEYMRVRGAELSKNRTEESAKLGLIRLSDEDREALKKGDKDVFNKYRNISLTVKASVVQVDKKTDAGAEVVAGGLDVESKSQKEILTENLRKEIAIKIANGQVITAEENAFYEDLNLVFAAVLAEEAILIENQNKTGQFFKDTYEVQDSNQATSEVIRASTDAVNAPLGTEPQGQATQVGGQSGLSKAFDVAKGVFGKGNKANKKTAFGKLENAFSSLANKAVSGALNFIPGVGTGASIAYKALTKLVGNEKANKIVAGLVAGIGLSFAALFSKFVYPLLNTMWGGGGGSVASTFTGGSGLYSSGGAYAGGGGLGAGRVAGSGFLDPAFVNRFAPNAGQELAKQGLLSKATTTLTGMSIGVMAPIIAMIFIFIMSFQTILIIHSSFLIKIPQNRISVGSIIPISGEIGSGFCKNTDLETMASIKDTITNPIAEKAYYIVEKLQPGFWGYCNQHPDYPELFDENEFKLHPNHCVYSSSFPPGCSGDHNKMGGNVLFWCTWLVLKSYEETYSLVARVMADQFKTKPNHIYFPAESITYDMVKPGDTIFTATTGRGGNIGHVAIVAYVDQDVIISLDSNASARFHSFTVGEDGKIIVDSISYLTVVGFGRRL